MRRFKIKTRGFTLVELIVVITILVILGTIALVSLGSFAGSARDSSRVSDLALIAKGLDLHYIKQSSFPTPSGAVSVSYSGAALWQQGNAGETVITALWSAGAKLSTKPTDPLLRTEYGYSLSTGMHEYSLRTDYEGDSVALYSTPWADRANAATGNPTLAYIRGTYNGVATKTSTGGKVHILAIPSIFTVSKTTTISETSAALFIVHGESLSGAAFTPKVVFSSESLPESDDERIIFASGIVAAYSGSSFAVKNGDIRSFIDALSSTGKLADHGGNFVRTRLGGTASNINIPAGTPSAPALKAEIAKLTASDKASSDWFGYSVAISSGGNTAIVGAYAADPGGTSTAGATYVFVRSGTTWSEQAKLTASDKATNDWFGYSVAISSDGNTAIIGASHVDLGVGKSDAGAAYVFTRSGGTWTETARLAASDKVNGDNLGWSVAISGDGNSAIAGAYVADPGGLGSAGAAYIFQ